LTIVPRWEWRAFGDDFGDAEARLADPGPERVEESDELYLLSARSDASVKVREGQMDVKRLEAVNDDGLEQWRPVLKAPFPLSRAQVEEVLDVLGCADLELERDEYPLEALRDEVVAPSPDLQTAEVHKRREHYTVGGCLAERSEIGTAAATTQTIAVESEDAGRVIAAVRELGLDDRRNVSLPRELKTLLGIAAHRYAAIDVGTNSVKLYVGELRADGAWSTVVERSEITRLGEGLEEGGPLREEPMERTLTAIEKLADEARRNGAEAIVAAGTAGLRMASNSDEFVKTVHERAGIELEVISGEDESRLAYHAVEDSLGRLGLGSVVMFDTGGGSSQFTFGQGEEILERFSVNVGAVRYTERFGLDKAVDEAALAAALDAIASDLARLDGRAAPDVLVGIGGALTNLAAVKLALEPYDPERIRNAELERDEVERQIELYRSRSADERREIVGLQPKRAEVILAGACIVRTVLEKLGADSLRVADRGLRHGLLAERFSGGS
jgi:exopolyphosphatase/guanosine-5'-triphosphate,3'-diphosphate pyrophosphatase